MKKAFFIILFAFIINIVFADGPVIDLLEPDSIEIMDFSDYEFIDIWVIVKKWDSSHCTSDIFQTIRFLIVSRNGIDWSSFGVSVVAFGGCIGRTFYFSSPLLDTLSREQLDWASKQDYQISIDTISDTSFIVTVTPTGRRERPNFICSDSCSIPTDTGDTLCPCCINVGDINSPGFGHTSALFPEFWTAPIPSILCYVRDTLGNWGDFGTYFCVDYSGPTATHPKPTPDSTVDTTSPIISIVILDTVWVRHTAYPNPYEPWFPHCPCGDSTCVDSTGEPLEPPYCGLVYIDWTPVDTTSIRLSVDGTEYTMESPGMHWIDDSLLVFNTGEAGLSFSEGETVRVCLEEATDMVSQGYGPNHLGRHLDWTHPDTPVPFCWEFYIGDVGVVERNETPKKFAIKSIEPNPFNSIVSIDYSIGEKTYIDISVYDVLGQKVKTLVNKKQSAGNYKVNWDATNKPSGVYFVHLKTQNHTITKRAILMR